MGKCLCEDDVKKVVINGWVRCGNRWLARLLFYYADEAGRGNIEILAQEHYWFGKTQANYFGQPATIRVSHMDAVAYKNIDSDAYIIHIKRDPRDVFVSWYYLLLRSDMLKGIE